MSRACKETPTMTQLWHSVQPADLDIIDGSPGQEFSLETEHEQVWKHVVWKGDAVVDATCGNGYDTLAMLKMVADQSKRGRVYGMHVQKVAIESTSSLLDQSVSSDEKELVGLYSICHSKMDEIVPKGVTLRRVYDEGYLCTGAIFVRVCEVLRMQAKVFRPSAVERLLLRVPCLCNDPWFLFVGTACSWMCFSRISSGGILNGAGSLMGLYLLRFCYTVVQGLRIAAGMMPG
ncbi:unnamed protein product [Ilex paraguariensis]|uniref:S-adenosyl-L-methionine-dependent methyltransferase superfamily protein n=1 Tax=Ilex paraguariensis TaxID=185542 RepID=A0ABC8SNK2_9AQUA